MYDDCRTVVHILRFVSLMKLSSKKLAIYFIIIFVVVVLSRIFVSPWLWPEKTELVDPIITLMTFTVAGLGLGLIYYLKTAGSPKQMRLFFVTCSGLGFGFILSIVSGIILATFIRPVPLLLTFLLYAIMFIAGAYIGDKIGKKRGLY